MIVNEVAIEKKRLFLKDPETSDLGRRIISNSIKIIDEVGFDSFNFKKLAVSINSTEASIYRYFENKYKLLFYLISWYWSWVKTTIEFKTYNIKDPKDKLKAIIKVICNSHFDDPNTKEIDESALCRIVITEATKSYTTKNVEIDYKDGLFEAYKEVCKKIESVIKELNGNYKKPKALTLTIIRSIHKQIYFCQHLPELTDLELNNNDTLEIEDFIEDLTFSILKIR